MERESGLGPPRPHTPTDPDASLRVLVADDEGLIRNALFDYSVIVRAVEGRADG